MIGLSLKQNSKWQFLELTSTLGKLNSNEKHGCVQASSLTPAPLPPKSPSKNRLWELWILHLSKQAATQEASGSRLRKTLT